MFYLYGINVLVKSEVYSYKYKNWKSFLLEQIFILAHILDSIKLYVYVHNVNYGGGGGGYPLNSLLNDISNINVEISRREYYYIYEFYYEHDAN